MDNDINARYIRDVIYDLMNCEDSSETILENLQRSLKDFIDEGGIVKDQDCVYIAVHAIFATALRISNMCPELSKEEICDSIEDCLAIEAEDLLHYLQDKESNQ